MHQFNTFMVYISHSAHKRVLSLYWPLGTWESSLWLLGDVFAVSGFYHQKYLAMLKFLYYSKTILSSFLKSLNTAFFHKILFILFFHKKVSILFFSQRNRYTVQNFKIQNYIPELFPLPFMFVSGSWCLMPVARVLLGLLAAVWRSDLPRVLSLGRKMPVSALLYGCIPCGTRP